jgi:hypothetical protein
MAMSVEPHCLELFIASYYQLVCPTNKPGVFLSEMSMKLMLLLLSWCAEWTLEFSNKHGGHLCCSQHQDGSKKSAEMHHETWSEAFPGHNTAYKVKNMCVKEVLHSNTASDSKNDPHQWKQLAALLPGPHTAGYSPVLDCHQLTLLPALLSCRKRLIGVPVQNWKMAPNV